MIRSLLAGLAIGLGATLAGSALLLRGGARWAARPPAPALRLRAGLLRELFHSVQDAILLVRWPDRVIVGCNPAAEHILGYPRAELVGRTTRFLHESDESFEGFSRRGGPFLRRGEVFRTEHRLRRRDGTVFPTEHTVSRVRGGGDGVPELVVAVIRDITERRSALEALRTAHDRRRAMFDASPHAIVRLDERGRVADWSPGAERILGWRAEEVTGRHAPFVPDDAATEYGELFGRLRAGVTLSGIEGRARRKDGTRFDALLSAAPLRSGEGGFAGALVIVADISRQRDLERQLLEVTEQERTRLGEDLHDSLGQILTGVNFAARALKEDLAARARPEAVLAGEIETLVTSALDRTRQMARGLSPVDLRGGSIQKALVELCREAAELFGIECETGADPTLELPGSDALHLYYIAREAVHNAVRHGGATRVEVGLARAGNGYTLTVRDDGTGLAEDAMADQGLGIAIMRHRCTLLGGRLTIESPEENGVSLVCRVDPDRPAWQL